ncbi:hypothetical protein CYY_000165 [Polysphondylium violaceum]|uniref:J domain-containing protein n=1 Tax=Polysphondylium violaceum TaxID=133409 RepID=A0A8J4UXH2_9MYCE|nr:hypothetical protein CYY_000165 [Polysphondylium violaceum]
MSSFIQLTNDEIDNILFATNGGTINLYTLISIDPSVSIEQIHEHYRKLDKVFNYELIERNINSPTYELQEGDELLLKLLLAFKILRNPKLKAKYDEYLQRTTYYDNMSTPVKVAYMLFFFFAGKACDVAYCLSDISKGKEESRQLLKSQFKQSYFSSLRGLPFKLINIPAQAILSLVPEKYSELLESLVFYPTMYFIPMLTTVYPAVSVFNIIKGLLIDPQSKQPSWSRFYYGFTVFALRQLYIYGIEETMTYIRDKVQKNYLYNLNSRFWEISNRICSSSLARSLVFISLISPVQVIFHQYQATALARSVGPSIIPFAKSIYYGQGLAQLFNPFGMASAVATTFFSSHFTLLTAQFRKELEESIKREEEEEKEE